MLWSVRRFKHLFVGKTTILTDHEPLLENIQDEFTSRWLMEIHESDVMIHHIAGEDNLADALSRALALQQAQEEPISSDDIKKTVRGEDAPRRAQLAISYT